MANARRELQAIPFGLAKARNKAVAVKTFHKVKNHFVAGIFRFQAALSALPGSKDIGVARAEAPPPGLKPKSLLPFGNHFWQAL